MNTLISCFTEWSEGVYGMLGNSRVILEGEGSKLAISALIKYFPFSSVVLHVRLVI